MPIDRRISQLLKTLKGELYHDKLWELSQEFEALAQDRVETLPFFVLQSVCIRLARELDDEPVTFERFQALTDGIAEQISAILRRLNKGTDVAALENLVATLFKNLALSK
jgi:hypothetical protein